MIETLIQDYIISLEAYIETDNFKESPTHAQEYVLKELENARKKLVAQPI